MKILVTGASSGFGYETTRELLRGGHSVVGVVRSNSDALQLCAEFHGYEFWAGLADVRNKRKLERIADRHGPFDAVVTGAGYSVWGPLETVTAGDFATQFDVNVTGVLNTIQAVLPGMRSQRGGVIVNIGSTVSAKLGSGPYAASKAALRAMTEVLAVEVAPFGLCVALIEPGAYATKYARNRVLSGLAEGKDYLAVHGVEPPPADRPGRDPSAVARLIRCVVETQTSSLAVYSA